MKDFTTVKMFGTGQVTIPKKMREDVKTKEFIVFRKMGNIILKPIKLVDDDTDEKGWTTILDLSKEGGVDMRVLRDMLRKDIAKKQKAKHGQNKKISQKSKH